MLRSRWNITIHVMFMWFNYFIYKDNLKILYDSARIINFNDTFSPQILLNFKENIVLKPNISVKKMNPTFSFNTLKT